MEQVQQAATELQVATIEAEQQIVEARTEATVAELAAQTAIAEQRAEHAEEIVADEYSDDETESEQAWAAQQFSELGNAVVRESQSQQSLMATLQTAVEALQSQLSLIAETVNRILERLPQPIVELSTPPISEPMPAAPPIQEPQSAVEADQRVQANQNSSGKVRRKI